MFLLTTRTLPRLHIWQKQRNTKISKIQIEFYLMQRETLIVTNIIKHNAGMKWKHTEQVKSRVGLGFFKIKADDKGIRKGGAVEEEKVQQHLTDCSLVRVYIYLAVN